MSAGACILPPSIDDPRLGTRPVSTAQDGGSTSEELGFLDDAHERWSRRVKESAAWLDSFLANERVLAEKNTSSAVLRLETFAEEHEGLSFKPKLSARVVLPHSEDRLHLVVSGENDEGLDQLERPGDVGPLEDSNATLGFQYFIKETDSNNARGELGLRFTDMMPDPYVGMRLRHTKVLGEWALRARERLRLYSSDGFESQTNVDFERPMGEVYFFRSSTSWSWYESEPGFYYGQYFAIYQQLADRSLMTYEWNNRFLTRPNHVLDETQLRMRFARRIHRKWILLELAPQITLRRAINYKPAWGFMIRLELLFGGAQDL